ncbi:MAG TPA: hypothetical protein VJV78_23735, partial [Polyangiales bacterium]|nr:hypothetical protein [Polyangiales bacterium]
MSTRSWAWLVLIGCWALAGPQLTAAAQDDDLDEDLGEEAQPKAEDAPAAADEGGEGTGEAQEAPEAGEAAAPAASADADTGPT